MVKIIKTLLLTKLEDRNFFLILSFQLKKAIRRIDRKNWESNTKTKDGTF